MFFVCENLKNLFSSEYLNFKLNSDLLKRFITKFGSRNISVPHFWIYEKGKKIFPYFADFQRS